MYCRNCGAPVGEKDLFCRNCGAKIEKEVSKEKKQNENPFVDDITKDNTNENKNTVTNPFAEQTQATAESQTTNNTQEVPPQPQQPAQQPQVQPQQPQKNNGAIIAIVIIAVFLFGFGIIGWGIWKAITGAIGWGREIIDTIDPNSISGSIENRIDGYNDKFEDFNISDFNSILGNILDEYGIDYDFDYDYDEDYDDDYNYNYDYDYDDYEEDEDLEDNVIHPSLSTSI